jgi:hypothetical protein
VVSLKKKKKKNQSFLEPPLSRRKGGRPGERGLGE